MGYKMEINLVAEALKFMVLGMGIVFIFLTIMIFVLKAQAYLIAKYVPENDDKASNSNEWQPAKKSNDDIIAAITGAIIHHSKSNKKG
jgi:oxaloacetate decarboxylase gamma subunit